MPSALALLIALFHRKRTGQGQSMWSSIFNGSMLYTLDSWLDEDGMPSPRPIIDREQLGLDALYRLYETRDGWLQLAAVRERDWPALCGALDRKDLISDPRFATPADRASHRGELTKILAEAFFKDHATNWRRALDAAGVPSEVSANTWDGETMLFDEELVRLGLVAEYEHPLLGRVRQFGNLFTFSDTPCEQKRATPMLGQHTQEILSELGYKAEAMEELRSRKIIGWPDDNYPFRV
jgi:crotonobetainyl-CoA:carnitine CoA-transferase CaiB-like acyl-CoA transferase